jgi:hypothetical protein
MPKEKINGVESGPFEVADGEDDPGHPLVEVRWNRWPDSYVSVVTRLSNCELSPPGQDILASYGFYVELDRDGINDVIRKLRRARDQAFGRDE